MTEVSEIYPCKDHPAVCGWDRKPEYGKCIYPNCWCDGWLVGSPLNNKLIVKGQSFKAILYRGYDDVIAYGIYRHMRDAKNSDKAVPLSDSKYTVRLSNVEIVRMGDVYQVDITGELE